MVKSLKADILSISLWSFALMKGLCSKGQLLNCLQWLIYIKMSIGYNQIILNCISYRLSFPAF